MNKKPSYLRSILYPLLLLSLTPTPSGWTMLLNETQEDRVLRFGIGPIVKAYQDGKKTSLDVLKVATACITLLRSDYKNSMVVWRQIEAAGITPSLITYNALLNNCANTGHGKMARSLLDEMWAKNVIPDRFSYTAVINACKRECQQDQKRASSSSTLINKIPTDVFTYNNLIDVRTRFGFYAETQNILTEMWIENVQPNLRTYTSIFQAFIRAEKKSEITPFFLWLTHSMHEFSRNNLNSDLLAFTCSRFYTDSLIERERTTNDPSQNHVSTAPQCIVPDALVLVMLEARRMMARAQQTPFPTEIIIDNNAPTLIHTIKIDLIQNNYMWTDSSDGHSLQNIKKIY